jgi:methionyl aminopeptidase
LSEALDLALKAGKVASEVRDEIRRKVTPGMTLKEVCIQVEKSITQRGAEPAFPCNVCLNEVAAHYTTEGDVDVKVKEGDLLKVDIGAAIDGNIADTALTLCFNSQLEDMVLACEGALNEALRVVRAGVRAADLGRIISDFAKRRGYRPITNLSGHQVSQYVIHAGVSIPNTWVPGSATLKENSLYAVEPFFTLASGQGQVTDGGSSNIYALTARRRVGEKNLDNLVDTIWQTRRTLPFAARFYEERWSLHELKPMLKELVKMKVLRLYPILVEAGGTPVAQAEHTVMVTSTGLIITTA